MRMNPKLAGILSGVALIAAPLSAQEKPITFNVGGAYMSTFDDIQNVTHKSSAYQLSVGMTTHLLGTDVPFRVTLADNVLPGATHGITNIKSSLNGVQLAGDVLIGSGLDNLNFVTGLSINKWSLSNKGTEPTGEWVPQDPGAGLPPLPPGQEYRYHADNYYALKEDKGIKFGARLGMEYRFDQHWTSDLMVQVIEVGTGAKNSAGNSIVSGVNASWIQLGVKYHF